MTRHPAHRLGRVLLVPLVLVINTTVAAQTHADPVLRRSRDVGAPGPLAEDLGVAGLQQQIARLTTTASVLYTTGHPDDEEAGVLTLLSRGMGTRTALLTLNRGEGGANALGDELFDALGLVRTEELRLAGRYYGLDDQYFTTAADYGYSKTLDEAFRSWNREALIEDMVRVIRMNRPLVVISRWHGSERDGHGHHQASGVLTPEAVLAAGDATRFPSQIEDEGLRPWSPKKLYRSRIQDGEPWHVELDPGQYNAWLGRSYQDLGAFGLSLQRSQTSGRGRTTLGSSAVRLERLLPRSETRDEVRERGLFDGIDTSLPGLFRLMGEEPPEGDAVARLQAATRHVEAAAALLGRENPASLTPHLARGLSEIEAVLGQVRPQSDVAFALRTKARQFREAIRTTLAIRVKAWATPAGSPPTTPMGPAVPGQDLSVFVNVSSGTSEPMDVTVSLVSDDEWPQIAPPSTLRVPKNETVQVALPTRVPDGAAPTREWFYRESIAENTYQVRDSSMIHFAERPPVLYVNSRVFVEGQPVEWLTPVRTLESDAPYGTVSRELVVAEPVAVSVDRATRVVTAGSRNVPLAVAVEVRSNQIGALEGTVSLDLPDGWSAIPTAVSFRLDGAGETQQAPFEVEVPLATGGPWQIRARVSAHGREFTEGYRTIQHRDLETKRLYRPASVHVVAVDVAVREGLTVGYIMGVGDEVPAAIEELGGQVHLLGESDLASAPLEIYDAIVVGTRAYAVRSDLVAHNGRLLEYARSGGNVVILYQTPEYTPETQAPFDASLPRSAEEVSEEDSPVTLLAPDHPVMAGPNRITARDFDGWIEQRGSKFFAEWDPAYTALIETHDTGQSPQRGIWLTAPVGRGHFTYIALALHRQVPYGVPGAYRILANVLSRGADPANPPDR